MSYFVYILECNDGTLYTGITKDISKRLDEHNYKDKGAKYTKARRPVKLLYEEKASDRSVASKRVYSIKKLTRLKKTSINKQFSLKHSKSKYKKGKSQNIPFKFFRRDDSSLYHLEQLL